MQTPCQARATSVTKPRCHDGAWPYTHVYRPHAGCRPLRHGLRCACLQAKRKRGGRSKMWVGAVSAQVVWCLGSGWVHVHHHRARRRLRLTGATPILPSATGSLPPSGQGAMICVPLPSLPSQYLLLPRRSPEPTLRDNDPSIKPEVSSARQFWSQNKSAHKHYVRA